MKLVTKFLLILGLIFSISCAVSPKTSVVKIGDTQLSQQQILSELERLNETERQINNNKGVTGTNVAAFLFWMPGLAYTYYDASEALKLVEQRRSHLSALYNEQFAQETHRNRKAA